MAMESEPRKIKRLDRADEWAMRNPWLWAVVGGLMALVFGANVLGSWVLGLILAPVWFVVVGWSMSRGPGRRLYERQHRELP